MVPLPLRYDIALSGAAGSMDSLHDNDDTGGGPRGNGGGGGGAAIAAPSSSVSKPPPGGSGGAPAAAQPAPPPTMIDARDAETLGAEYSGPIVIERNLARAAVQKAPDRCHKHTRRI